MPVGSLGGAIKQARCHSFVEAGDHQSYSKGRGVELMFRSHGAVDYSAILAMWFCEPVTFAGLAAWNALYPRHARNLLLLVAFGHAALVIHTA